MVIKEEDVATALLKQLLEKHPEATDDEIWELFRQAANDDDDVRGAVEKDVPSTLWASGAFFRSAPLKLFH